MDRTAYVTADSRRRKCAEWLSAIDSERGRAVPAELGRTVLLAIDLQALFIDPSSPAYLPAWAAAESRAFGLVEAFLNRRFPVVFTRHVHDTGDSGGVLGHFFDRLLLRDDPLSQLTPRAAGFSPPAIIHEKRTHAAFAEAVPRAVARADTAVLVGVQSHLCIMATALDLARLNVIPVVVADAVAAPTEELHLAALRVLASAHAHVVTSDELAGLLTEEPVV